jgi:hypothetical protein
MRTGGMMMALLLVTMVSSESALAQSAAPDTVDIRVGSPRIRALDAADLVAHVTMLTVASTKATEVGTAVWTFRTADSAGMKVLRAHSEGRTRSADGKEHVSRTDITLDRATLKFYAYRVQPDSGSSGNLGSVTSTGSNIRGTITRNGAPQEVDVHLTEPAFFGNLADLLVEALPRSLDTVYRASVWRLGAQTSETHLYRAVGRENVAIEGVMHEKAWIVEDRSADGARLLGRMWLIREPPYLVRWELYGPSTDSPFLRLDQTLVQLVH